MQEPNVDTAIGRVEALTAASAAGSWPTPRAPVLPRLSCARP
jgi:hypothetical protein